ncbi:MAG: 2-C-methyl-D-erythritol 2,4-cyclodiphosphate synthase [Erysipelotrichaceae bacterium]|uniref:2-C-methyl-D-erythritol 2,4-cyclodiphosphate synthase n=1 Tax=Faecalicoccus pleomorphus TaxID=1323 RepID=UPI0026E955E9|nr:2-C-methyl-D-erythritol 2,4-cyclodiphosphate synthase [Faecalicoccus pleomorphus]MBE6119777.1 2-C-methyl-D-erythritol 2,4-cyclodiphosphate synthase [Erysipelotrichaceae bacterium]
MRIGQSIDIHQLKQGRPLILGGVSIEHEKGLDGHSDADVLTHAIMESILGALSLGDLGKHFPDTDPSYKGANSLQLCTCVYEMMVQKGYKVGNVDATIVMERPKLAPYIDQMRNNIAQILHCRLDQISIKATRGEKMGFIGHEEGAAAFSVCLLEEVK